MGSLTSCRRHRPPRVLRPRARRTTDDLIRAAVGDGSARRAGGRGGRRRRTELAWAVNAREAPAIPPRTRKSWRGWRPVCSATGGGWRDHGHFVELRTMCAGALVLLPVARLAWRLPRPGRSARCGIGPGDHRINHRPEVRGGARAGSAPRRWRSPSSPASDWGEGADSVSFTAVASERPKEQLV